MTGRSTTLDNYSSIHHTHDWPDTDGNKARATEIFEISLETLYNRLDRYQSEMRFAKLAWCPRAIGYHLNKSYSRNEPVYRFEHAGILYEISRAKAQVIGRKFIVPGGVCPHLLPVSEMDRIVSIATEKTSVNPGALL